MASQRPIRTKRKAVEVKVVEEANWWTKDDPSTNALMAKLLARLQSRGFDGNYRDLQQEFNNCRSDSSFRNFFDYLRKNDDPSSETFDEERHKVSLMCDPWIEALRKNNENQRLGVNTPLMLKLIARFEKHPSPSECGGVDYKEIYECLASLMQGYIPKQMSAPSAAKLQQITRLMSDHLKNEDDAEKSFLSSMAVQADTTTLKDRNQILKSRRNPEWSQEEKESRQQAISPDFEQMRSCYLKQYGLNPMQFTWQSFNVHHLFWLLCCIFVLLFSYLLLERWNKHWLPKFCFEMNCIIHYHMHAPT